MNIRLVQRADIEQPKWDGCVFHANNSMIYGFTWYLDNVCEDWVGLVEGDYESVFPLVYNTKLLGIKQLYQPLLTQQLGLFSVNALSSARLEAFLDAIPKEFKLVNICLNDRNRVRDTYTAFHYSPQPNYVLHLNLPYEEIERNYSDMLRRNLRKAIKADLTLGNNIKPERLVEMVKAYHKEKGNKIPDSLYHTALRIIYNCMHRGVGFMSGAISPDGEILAAAFFMYSKGRIINLLNVTTTEGRKVNAMHFVIDMLIRTHANQPALLDFEGTSIAPLAQFYQSFGSLNQAYYKVSRNDLPQPIKFAYKMLKG
jgi:hypothetical protein